MTRKRQPIEDRFWSKVQKTDQCWEWVGYVHPSGYGQISRGGRDGHTYVHRVSWEIHYGCAPDGLYVLHRCDNRRCVNPTHLFLGTYADNHQDMILKGRSAHTKLNLQQVRDIRQRYEAGGITNRQLALEYGVTTSCIKAITGYHNWTRYDHITIKPG
jgi:hypothetical protein